MPTCISKNQSCPKSSPEPGEEVQRQRRRSYLSVSVKTEKHKLALTQCVNARNGGEGLEVSLSPRLLYNTAARTHRVPPPTSFPLKQPCRPARDFQLHVNPRAAGTSHFCTGSTSHCTTGKSLFNLSVCPDVKSAALKQPLLTPSLLAESADGKRQQADAGARNSKGVAETLSVDVQETPPPPDIAQSALIGQLAHSVVIG
ncbi:unnamed protein product [Pleuronectes platessa]|uniref:Uncharacterized protein n=1 Tax=Pleuronectes platessa TaxID=8262 RepID=A0A9N7W3A7_PLEPL|nr:unnamed protein product [Pleuronectes platessa]